MDIVDFLEREREKKEERERERKIYYKAIIIAKNKMGNSKTKPEATKSNSTEATNENDTSTPSIYPQLQIRNCIRNVRNNSSTFSDMYPNEAGTSCGTY